MKAREFSILLPLLLNLLTLCLSMNINPDGRYTQVTVKISPNLPDSQCPQLLNNLKKLLVGTSRAVGVASSWLVWPSQFIIVVPAHWSSSTCRTSFMSASGRTRYVKEDFLIHEGLVHASSNPYTIQTGGCGRTGERTQIPALFLLDSGQKKTENIGS